MKELTIPHGALRILLEQIRAIHIEIESDTRERDLRRNELRTEIEALNRDQQHELVALMWIGRGDFDETDWAEAKALAEERHVGPTFDYLMEHPLAAERIASGLEDIGQSHVLLEDED